MTPEQIVNYLRARGVVVAVEEGQLKLRGKPSLYVDLVSEVKEKKDQIIAHLAPPQEDITVQVSTTKISDPIEEAEATPERDFWERALEMMYGASQNLRYAWEDIDPLKRPVIDPERDDWARAMNIAFAARDEAGWEHAYDQWIEAQMRATERARNGQQIEQWAERAAARARYRAAVGRIHGTYNALSEAARPNAFTAEDVIAAERAINRGFIDHDVQAVDDGIAALLRAWKAQGLPLTNIPKT